MNSQYQVKVSLNWTWRDIPAKPGGDGFDWTTFTYDFEMKDISLSDLAELCRHNIPLCNPFKQNPVAGKDTCRHVVNMAQYTFFQEDIDKGFNLSALSQDAFVQQYGTLLLSSFHWQPSKPRGKVLYFLQEPIKDGDRARFFARAILWYRQRITNPDPSVKDPLRFAFTCNPKPNNQEFLLLGNLLPPDVVDSIINAYRVYLAEAVQANEKKTILPTSGENTQATVNIEMVSISTTRPWIAMHLLNRVDTHHVAITDLPDLLPTLMMSLPPGGSFC